MEKNLPTAEELMNSKEYEPDSGISFEGYHGDNAAMVPSMMIEFAKLHVEQALKEIEIQRCLHHYPPIQFINKTDLIKNIK